MTVLASKRSLSPVLIIFLTIFIDMVGFGIVIPILPLYSLHFGAEPWQIGLLFASFSLAQLISAPVLGRLSDRFGRRPILILSMLGTAFSFIILGLAHSLWMLFLGRIVDGISGANISTAQAYIADVTPLDKRSAAMGMIGAAFGLGFVFGPAIGGLLGHYSIELPFFVAGGLALLNTVALWLFLPESLTEENRKLHPAAGTSIWKTLREAKNTPLGTLMMCSLLSTMAFSLMTALFTLFTQQRLKWHAQENGLLFAYIGILGVIIQGGMLRRLVPRTGEKPLIIIGSIVLCISSILLPISSNLALIILASSGLSIGNSLTTPMLSGLASKSADAQSQGAVMGLMQSIASLGRMLGPALGGVLLNYDWLNPSHPYGITPFWFAAILMLFAIVAAYRLVPTKHTLHLEQTP